jgi:sugar lactone lactonase YvrE
VQGPRALLTGLAFGESLRWHESPRWHEGRLWFSDFGSREVVAVDLDGNSEVVARVPGMPMGLGFLPDGNLLAVSARDGLLLRSEAGGQLATYADLTGLAGHPWSDMVIVAAATPTSATSASTSRPASSRPESSPWSPPAAPPARSPAGLRSPTA